MGWGTRQGIIICGIVCLGFGGGAANVWAADSGTRGVCIQAMAGEQGGEAAFWLFSIGIANYKEWPVLQTPISDVTALREVLQSEYRFDAEHTREILDEQATYAGIVKGFETLIARTDENDSILIYFAGHGHEDGYWIPQDGGLNSRANWLSTVVVKDFLQRIPARHILLISDSCFSGGLVLRGAMDGARTAVPVMPVDLRAVYNRRSRFALTSGGMEPVKDGGISAQHSVFAFFLLNALKANRHPYMIAPAEPLFGYILNGLAANPMKQPQHPVYGQILDAGSASGQFVFFRSSFDASLTNVPIRPIVPIAVLASHASADTELDLPEFDGSIRLLVTNPQTGRLKLENRPQVTLDGATHISLAQGRHRFSMQLDTGERLGGMITIGNVDEGASVTQFGLGRGIFFQPHHIRAALEGRPVRYSVRINDVTGEREVISYVMSLLY